MGHFICMGPFLICVAFLYLYGVLLLPYWPFYLREPPPPPDQGVWGWSASVLLCGI